MVVIARRYGRLANRLVLFSHVIAAARAAGVSVANPAFGDYAHHFRHTRNDLWCRFPSRDRERPPAPWCRKLAYQLVYGPARAASYTPLARWPFPVVRLRGNESLDLSSPATQALFRSSRFVFLDGWLFRCQSLIGEAAPVIRDFLQPAPEHETRIAAVLAPLRQSADVVVGVHIRHGDFRTFEGGRYFFPVEAYRRWMDQARELLAPKRIAFVICTDGQHDPAHWRGLTVADGPGHPVSDLFALSACDYLLGPPSTYSYFASFFGRTPGYWFESADEELTSFSEQCFTAL